MEDDSSVQEISDGQAQEAGDDPVALLDEALALVRQPHLTHPARVAKVTDRLLRIRGVLANPEAQRASGASDGLA